MFVLTEWNLYWFLNSLPLHQLNSVGANLLAINFVTEISPDMISTRQLCHIKILLKKVSSCTHFLTSNEISEGFVSRVLKIAEHKVSIRYQVTMSMRDSDFVTFQSSLIAKLSTQSSSSVLNFVIEFSKQHFRNQPTESADIMESHKCLVLNKN